MKILRAASLVLVAGVAASGSSCSSAPATPDLGSGNFHVTITSVNGSTTLPTAANPLPPNLGVTNETWAFTVEARTPTGNLATDYNSFVRLTVVPGTLVSLTPSTGIVSQGRNIQLQNGKASGVLEATGVYGPAALWIEDLGYVPAQPNTLPKCADGIDNNNNGLIDYPADPGCYFADDDTEDGGTYNEGVSPAVQYALPTIMDVRGQARTPFSNEAVNIAAADPRVLVVTQVAGDGFFVTDVSPPPLGKGGAYGSYNSLFAYNFSTPANMQVCDRIIQLSGTASDFYGFTQISFPSYLNTYSVLGADGGPIDPTKGIPGCLVPEPFVLDPGNAQIFSGDKNTTSAALFPYEAGLVRLENFTIADHFGPTLAKNNVFAVGQSNCDFNGNGKIDYTSVPPNCPVGECEGTCANDCDLDVDCSEWTNFVTEAQYKVTFNKRPATMILVNSSTVSTFNPVSQHGQTIPMVTGTLTEFSGGSLNWTVATRCTDDLVCPAGMGCTTQQPITTDRACVLARTIYDNDEGTN